MAELILTEEERHSLTFLKWDDAALGKACKQVATILNDKKGDQSVKLTGAAVFIISAVLDSGHVDLDLALQGVTNPKPLGDWQVIVKRLGEPGQN